MWGSQNYEKFLILICRIQMPALATPVTVPQDGYFVLAATDKAGNILLVGEDDQQGNGDGKPPVQGLMRIEDIEDQHGKGYAGEDGTEGYKAGQVEDEEEYGYAADSRQGLDSDDHSE